jgi:Fic family protein
MRLYIYQRSDWPTFTWEEAGLQSLLGKVRNRQGKLVGRMESLGFDLRNEATLETLTLEIVKTSEIEGEILAPEQVRSSIARRLGMDQYGLLPSDRDVEGIVDLMLDATQRFEEPLTADRLLDGFTGNLTTSKWAKVAKCSSDTALRDIQDLVNRNILRRADSGGRSTHYLLTDLPMN